MSNSFFDWPASLSRFIQFDVARAEDINTALDSVSTGFDGVQTKTNAAIRLPDGETAATLPVANTRKGKVLSFNVTTGAVEANQEIGTYKGNWVTATAYAVRDIIKDAGTANIYICQTAHTSGTLATDISAAKWALIVDAATATSASSSASTSASNAATSASTATTQAGIATTQAGNAATSASNAATSASNAATSASEAAANAVVVGVQWAFESSTTMAAPATGGIRLNNAALSSVTAIAAHASSSLSGNPAVRPYVLTWDDSTTSVRGYITISKVGAPQNFAVYSVSGTITDNTTWAQLTVTHINSSGAFSASDTLMVGFSRTGDAGAGTGDVTGQAVSVDSEIALFSSTTGKVIKRATTTGLLKATSGVLAAAVAGTDYQSAQSVTGLVKSSGTTRSAAVAGTDYVAPTGADGTVTRQMLKDCGTVWFNAGAASALDYTNGSNQAWSPSGTVTLTLSNWPPTGNLGELLIEGNNLGAATITWPTINWIKSDGTTTTTFSSNGVTLQSSGTDWVYLWTRNAGTTIYGKIVR